MLRNYYLRENIEFVIKDLEITSPVLCKLIGGVPLLKFYRLKWAENLSQALNFFNNNREVFFSMCLTFANAPEDLLFHKFPLPEWETIRKALKAEITNPKELSPMEQIRKNHVDKVTSEYNRLQLRRKTANPLSIDNAADYLLHYYMDFLHKVSKNKTQQYGS